jgi:hypothetical protein
MIPPNPLTPARARYRPGRAGYTLSVVSAGRTALFAIGILVLAPLTGTGHVLVGQAQHPQHPQQPQGPQTPIPAQPEASESADPQPSHTAATRPPLPQVTPSPEATPTGRM